MSSAQVGTIGLALAALVVLGTGVRLTRGGRPYGTWLMTVHKLVDLAVVIAIGWKVYGASRAAPLSSVQWAVAAATTAFAVAVFATGGVASASEAPPAWVLTVHRVAPWFAGALAVATVYLLGGR